MNLLVEIRVIRGKKRFKIWEFAVKKLLTVFDTLKIG